LQPALASVDTATGLRWEAGGELEARSEANGKLFSTLPLCLALVIVLLVMQFNSFRKVSIIVMTIPLVFVGVVIGLLTMQALLGFMVTLGLFSLAGIIINNGIVLIDRIDLEIDSDSDRYEALIRAAESRFRPIMITMLTTVLGLLPLIWSQDPLFYGMASAIAFGLAVGTLFTLGVVPVLYSLLTLTGCASSPKTPKQAGFEGDYDGYQQRPDSGGAFNRLYTGTELLKYDKVAFSKPKLLHDSARILTPKEQQQLEAVSERLHQKLTETFADILAPTGPGVLRVQPIIIEGELTTNPKNLLDFIPFRIVVNAGTRLYREAQQKQLIEYQLAIALLGYDGGSGEQILGIVDRKSTGEIVINKDNLQGSDLDDMLDPWIARMHRNWLKAKSKSH
jgi:hypothetical protein